MIEVTENILMAFVVGGGICLIGQICFDVFRLSPAHTLCLLVTVGSVISGLGLYDRLIDFCGMGLALPILSFGNSLTNGALQGLRDYGFWGIFLGMFTPVSAGIAAAVCFSFFAALFFKPKY